MTDDRARLRTTFDSAADLYQQARPEYPAALYEALIATAGLTAGDRLLEVGCATGKATLPLARRGFRIMCVEIGAALVVAARRGLAGFPEVDVVQSAFETWDSPAAKPFDLVFAATAWHWLDPAIRYQRAWELLRPRGHLAFWSATHVFPDGGDPFFTELQEVYEEIGEGVPEGAVYPRPDELPDDREEIERSGRFEDVVVRHFDWELVYSAEGTCGCSTRSPVTSRWRTGSGGASTRRSDGDWGSGRMAASAATGGPSSMWPAEWTYQPPRKPILQRHAPRLAGTDATDAAGALLALAAPIAAR